jgi:hypothetical protein
MKVKYMSCFFLGGWGGVGWRRRGTNNIKYLTIAKKE